MREFASELPTVLYKKGFEIVAATLEVFFFFQIIKNEKREDEFWIEARERYKETWNNKKTNTEKLRYREKFHQMIVDEEIKLKITENEIKRLVE